MIEKLADMPAGTIGFRAGGEIEPGDYTEVLGPELNRIVESGERLRSLYLIQKIDEIEPRALWEDTKLGFGLVRRHDVWERSAIVTDEEWIARATRMFLWMFPGEARVFAVAELEAAKAWVATGDGAPPPA
jgi:stage II sporulation SpoAA-like protein